MPLRSVFNFRLEWFSHYLIAYCDFSFAHKAINLPNCKQYASRVIFIDAKQKYQNMIESGFAPLACTCYTTSEYIIALSERVFLHKRNHKSHADLFSEQHRNNKVIQALDIMSELLHGILFWSSIMIEELLNSGAAHGLRYVTSPCFHFA